MMRRRMRLPVLLMIALVFSGFAAEDVRGKQISEDHELNERGTAAFNSKDYKTALGLFTKAADISPNNHVYRFNIGNSYYHLNNDSEAIRAFTKALEISPSYEPSLLQRGWAYYRSGEYNKAIVDLDKLIGSKEHRLKALVWRGLSYYRKGMYKAALDDFDAALLTDRKSRNALFGRGWTYYKTGRFQEAIKDFTRALEIIDPNNKNDIGEALHGKALAYLGIEDGETAAHLIEKSRATGYLKDWPLIVFYYLSGDKQKAWRLRGGEGMFGLGMKDYKQGQIAGAQVVQVTKDSPAAEARFLENDVVISVDAAPVRNANDCSKAMLALKPGAIAEIGILREGMEKKMRVRVGSAEAIVLADPLAGPLVNKIKEKSGGGEIIADEDRKPAQAPGHDRPQAAGGDELR